MDEIKLVEFNTKLTALLKEYNVGLNVEDVPSTKKIVVVPLEQPKAVGKKKK